MAEAKAPTESNWVVFDIEGDALEATKLWCLSYSTPLNVTPTTITSYDDIRNFFTRFDVYIGHNIRRWDIPTVERLLKITIDKTFVDTLALSWYLEPSRKKNGIESYGEEFGIPKPKILDWENLNLLLYITRCETDVKINHKLWEKQLALLVRLYPKTEDLWRFLRYIDFKMYCAMLQEQSGWKLDVDKCESNLDELTGLRDAKLDALRAAMPSVPVTSTYQPPARRYNADGQPSVLEQRWQDRLKSVGLPEEHAGPIEIVTGYNEPNPGSHTQVKDWLYSFGWVPQTIKYQRDKKTGEIKEIPQVNKEHGGGICDSIKKLYDKEPAFELLDGLSIINHRISILNGFLRDVDDRGYIRASVQGFTNTLRFKHAVVVNLPKVEKEYGEFIRGCLVAPSGYELCGSDMAGLEDRLKQHFIQPFDPDYVAELNRPDYDPHLDIGIIAGGIKPEEAEFYKKLSKQLEDEVERLRVTPDSKNRYGIIKASRSIFKNGNYACQYGAGPPRLVITCGIDLETARNLHKAYWKRNWAIKAVAEAQKVQTIDGQMWLFNPISRFWYSLRTDKDRFSTLVQGSAAFCFDTWVGHILHDRPQLTAQFHDEVVLCVEIGHRDDIREWLEGTIGEVNDLLGLNRELGISVQFGERYSEIH